MKRLRSSDDIHSYGDKDIVKDWGRREEGSGLQRSSSSLHRSSYYRSSESGRKAVSSSASRYDRSEDDRESSKLVRKRPDYDLEGYDRRKGYDRHREGNDRGILSSSPRAGYGVDQMYRSDSFSGPRRDFPKGFRSERDRPKREGMAASWRRFGGGKDGDEGASKSGNESSRGSKMESKEVGMSKSPQRHREAKSPAWSKDSGSERSKSVEGKKCEDMPPVESVGPSSDREEGELQPDPQPNVALTKPADVGLKSSQEEKIKKDNLTESKVLQNKTRVLSVQQGDGSKVGSREEQAEAGLSKGVEDAAVKKGELPECRDGSFQETGASKDDNDAKEENEGGNSLMEGVREGPLVEEEIADSTCDEKLLSLQHQEEDGGTETEVKPDDMLVAGNAKITDGNELPSIEKTSPHLKDKGKSIAFLPSNSVHHEETNLEVEDKPRELVAMRDIEMEGPSTRGFQFFSTDPVRKPEKAEQSTHNKPKDDKLALELSLSLPNVLLPIGAQNREQAPGSPSHARSFQSFASSFRTNSDGFTASMSFSGSQQFTHNPSCSLTHDMVDYEKSVGSKPLFKGVDWKALSSEDNKNTDVPVYQGISSKENGLQLSQGNSSGQAMLQNLRVTGESSKLPIRLERQLSSNKHLSGANSFGSYENGQEHSKDRRQTMAYENGQEHSKDRRQTMAYENGPEHSKDRRQTMADKGSGSLQRNNGPDGKDQVLVVGADFAESVVMRIVSEPLHTMARRFNDMAQNHMACVKEFVSDIISNPGKQWQLSALQKALQKRSDFSLDMLLNAHRTQLEILVALKTGLRDFLLQKYEVASSDLAEIFLNMRCRNLSCRSLLPVDECDCKICAQRNDFCRECMCLVCSKFDMASNTCSWVGCDVCLHWCHADCGLRESHIRNGRSASGAQGTTEMQFYCVACGHPSEMFGFVKEVFQNFVKEWTAENLSRELEYVRRLFCASEDARGKQLHEIAVRMLTKLTNRAYLQEVQNHIMSFFNETNSERPGNTSIESTKELSKKEPPRKIQEGSNGVAGSSQGGAGWMKPIYPDKALHLENSISLLPEFNTNRIDDKYAMNMDFPKIAKKEQPIFDELESIVRIKLAEAKMFQARAEDARRESEALKHISVKKNEKIEEEYANRITKLRLIEAEEMRKQKVEELETHERAYQEYYNMKMRMETDIKDLLLKMEATRRNLTT